MKANELMVGDIFIYGKYICEVCIPPEGETIMTGLGDAIWIESKNFYGFVSIDDLKPIQITSEILNKNGWEQIYNYSDNEICTIYSSDVVELVYDSYRKECQISYNGNEYIFGEPFKYVHELQNILRTVFKIENEIVL